MFSAGVLRDLRDALNASVASLGAQLREHGQLVTRDSSSFLRLLTRTLVTIPGDVLAASVVINLLGLALPLAILQVYDRIVPQAATATLTFLVIGICAALAIETVLRVARGHVIAWAAMKRGWRTNVDAASRVALAPASLVDAQPAARWIQRLQAVATISEFDISPAPLVLIDLVFVVIFLALLVATSGWLAAIPVVVFLLFAVAVVKRGHQLRSATTERVIAEAKIRDFLIEALNGIVTVKALGTEQQILRRFERLSEQAARCTHNVVRLADDAQSSGSLISTLTQIATSTIGAVLAINGQISVGVVACSTMLAGRVVQPLLRLVAAWNEIQGVMVAEEVVKPVFDLPASRYSGARTFNDRQSPARLVFDNVCFVCERGEKPVLAGASLDVAPGEIIAITGRDNIGKSTVARLAAGQLVPQSGRVLVDGRSATDVAAHDRGSVAVVDHRNATIRGTVLNNLTLFRDAERLEEARAAARMIGLEAEINRLPRGYYTRVGEAASETLPVGLLQRIAIARAIAGAPRLLILDEANSSFDYASDQALGKGLLSLKGKITVVVITNRPSFAAVADRLFTLMDGEFCQLEQPSARTNAAIKTGGTTA
ncbi:MAG: ATP-binding cassette domain-containing protein [Hyphomicrobiaceae bacterium]|nr:MAG: ATP-binding cassette domain-containing protein [Hyphomicrobiaceae bacterium]